MLLSLFILILCGTPALAHGLEISIATPIMPPLGFQTLQLVSIAAFFLLAVFLYRYIHGMERFEPLVAAVTTMPLWYMTFSLVARSQLGLTNGVNGLALKPFPGLSWSYLGADFLQWNLAGVVLFTAITLLIGGMVKDIRERKGAMGLLGVVFIAGLFLNTLIFSTSGPANLPLLLLMLAGGILMVRGAKGRLIYLAV